MKKMVAALLMCTTVLTLSAQEHKGKDHHAGAGQKHEQAEHQRPDAKQVAQHRADRLQQELSLDEKQYKQVYDLFVKEAKQHEKQMKAEKEQKKEQCEKERAQHEKKMKKILNDAQFAQYTELKEQHRKRAENRPAPGELQRPVPRDLERHPVQHEKLRDDKMIRQDRPLRMEDGRELRHEPKVVKAKTQQ